MLNKIKKIEAELQKITDINDKQISEINLEIETELNKIDNIDAELNRAVTLADEELYSKELNKKKFCKERINFLNKRKNTITQGKLVNKDQCNSFANEIIEMFENQKQESKEYLRALDEELIAMAEEETQIYDKAVDIMEQLKNNGYIDNTKSLEPVAFNLLSRFYTSSKQPLNYYANEFDNKTKR